ncbi:septation protein SepH [Leucobacter triazinivorans]|uniref:DUF3071 domain-containing protein n=1 Tax=Leucobacter triazinivorans TaxID=1784719 RepID=A0A4P6KBB4_9MICO|nr:septation protein SepH [Leucobacter triazinivorans]QBE47507.1 DUF3071 domain-containing protein [Leucobacter triazinivorans]
MDELRFVRRDDRSLIVANEADEEFRLVVDDAVLSELRHLGRRERDTSRVRPRDIQARIRAGKSRAQVAKEMELDEADIERYAEPVLAERRYILERAHAVAVRTEASDEADQRFGAVIAERLLALGADTSEWESWRDDETGWMISLEFISHDVAHRAVWAFEHRKGTLSPVNPDAVNLSKLGDVGDRLIPKLRAVDTAEQPGRFDSDAFDASQLPLDLADEPEEDAPDTQQDGAAPTLSDTHAEYERRREIDQRAIKTGAQPPADLSQTADLLDALRKRRGERDRDRGGIEPHPAVGAPNSPAPAAPAPAEVEQAAPRARSIWQGAGVASDVDEEFAASRPAAVPQPSANDEPDASEIRDAAEGTGRAREAQSGEREAPERTGRKGRASIPSWDDILFGTRSDEDPV